MARLPAGLWAIMDFGLCGWICWEMLRLNILTFWKYETKGTLILAVLAALGLVIAGVTLNLYR